MKTNSKYILILLLWVLSASAWAAPSITLKLESETYATGQLLNLNINYSGNGENYSGINFELD